MWNTTVRGKNLIKRKMTDEERKLYGLPLAGKAKVEAELEARNIERTAMPEDDWSEIWERETTPNR